MSRAWLAAALLFFGNDICAQPAAPILRTRQQRAFRTAIREAAAKGPNFADHYTIAQWGCGAGCVSMAVIDSKTGCVDDGPFRILATETSEPLTFRLDSNLLTVRGCPEEKNCGSYFYEWTGSRFKLLRKTTARE